MLDQDEGVPCTAMREISLLKDARCDNIVRCAAGAQGGRGSAERQKIARAHASALAARSARAGLRGRQAPPRARRSRAARAPPPRALALVASPV